MQKKITYAPLLFIGSCGLFLFIGISIGFNACNFLNRAKYQIEIQEFRNTKTAECKFKQKKEEFIENEK